MRSSPFYIQPIFIVLIFLFLFPSCATVPENLQNQEANEPQRLMKKADELYKAQYYKDASEIYQKIRDRYPYSKVVVDAELKIADCLYMQGHYDEAYTAYSEFERLHPKNKKIPYVIYQKGMCHFNQVDTIDRDQSHTYAAKQEFERLVKRFPESKYAKEAIWKIRKCYINLTQYEMYVGNFYLKMGKIRAAMGRYRYALEHYPDMGQYHDAIEALSLCQRLLGTREEIQPVSPEEKLAGREDYPCWQCWRIKHGRPKALEEVMKKDREQKE